MADALSHLQGFVAAAVRGASPIAHDDDVGRRAESAIRPSPRGMRPHERLEVYREQFWLRHLANLQEDFPTLFGLLGEKGAHDLSREYLSAHPPRTWDLQRLGADVPAFVERHARLGEDALLVDAARLDWAFMEAFDAADSPPFDTRVLASTPEDAWPTARLALHPSVRLLGLRHPVHELRVLAQTGRAPERCAPAPTWVVVHRDAECRLLAVVTDAVAFGLLDTLAAGTPLGEACEQAARASGSDSLEVGAKLGGWFQDWTARGWIRAVSFTDPTV